MMTPEMRSICEENFCYLATASPDGRPNVVPVGLIKGLDDSRLLIVDVFFRKTRKNLEENPQVALAVTDVKRLEAYQFKGKAEIFTEGEVFDQAYEVIKNKAMWRGEFLKKLAASPGMKEKKEKIDKILKRHTNLKPKAVVVMTVEEVHPTLR